jgi:16S rRNA (cytosine1402-N4)-methyltransferase
MYHLPVLLRESVAGLEIRPAGVYVDVTFGGGGHSRAILAELGEKGRLFAFDRDQAAQANIPDDARFTLIPTDFQFIDTQLAQRGITSVDGILADLGVSSHQFDTADRGFSFRFDAELDMRMDREAPLSAKDVLHDYDLDTLTRLFAVYGEVPNPRKLATNIVEKRKNFPLSTTTNLELLIENCIPKKERSKYLAQVYQALRIEVNNEMKSLSALMNSSQKLLVEGGRMSVIAYHSLEDRMVKHSFRSGNIEDKIEKDFYGNVLSPWKIISKKAIVPSEAEVAANPRARSAKLRIAARI